MESHHSCGHHSPSPGGDYGVEFFKVFLPSFSSDQLLIPPGFAKQINGKIPKKATIADCHGRSWSVQLIQSGSGTFIKNGWEEFAADNSLEFGDFLIFCYHHSNSVFHVKIFGKNGCKKQMECPANNASSIIKIEDGDAVLVKKSVERIQSGNCSGRPIRNCRRKYAKSGLDDLHNSCADNNATQKSRLREDLMPKLPHFVGVVTKRNKTRMEVPSSFVKAHNIKLMSRVMLRDEKGNLWPSRTATRPQLAFCQGWGDFWCENLRRTGMYLFEFVLGEGNSCREVIVRAIPMDIEIERLHSHWVVKA